MDIKMMQQTNSKNMGPFGDVEVENGEKKQDKQKKGTSKIGNEEKTNIILKKGNIPLDQYRPLKNNINNIKLQEYGKKNREKKEKYENDVTKAKGNEREAEFQRSEKDRIRNKTKIGALLSRRPRRPPAGYKDPHEVCKQVLSTKVKEKKREEMKALMNCIAFTPSQTDLRVTSFEEDKVSCKKEKKEASPEETGNSSSSESTSITDVTPRSSSSGCSSMSKQSMRMDKIESAKIGEMETLPSTEKVFKSNREKKSLKNKNVRKISDVDEEKKEISSENDTKNLTEIEMEEMKYMQDAFENLDLDEETSEFASSIISGLSEERRAKCNRKNMTFTNEQLREIERVNLILLNKIMKHKKPKAKPLLNQSPVNRRTSASINRSRMEEKIERENKMLLKKLQSAKGTTNTLPKKGSQPQCYR